MSKVLDDLLAKAARTPRVPLSAERNCPPVLYPKEALATRVLTDPVNRWLLEALWHRNLSLEEITAAWHEMQSEEIPF